MKIFAVMPRLDATAPAELLADLQGTAPLPAEDVPEASRGTSLPASITYSFAHLAGPTRRLLPAVSLLRGFVERGDAGSFRCGRGGARPIRRHQYRTGRMCWRTPPALGC